jgi:predicted metallo-beta-lactamase superfamily hydrolase
MLQEITVVPLAAESLGVRSMCTYVETPDLRILMDPGVSLCPNRYQLPPHPKEFKAIINARKRISKFAAKANVVSISHYHFDHHTPSFEDWMGNWTDSETAQQIYTGKLVLAKNPRVNINTSQRRRGWVFQKTGGKHATKIQFADHKTFSFNQTTLTFSQPVPHGSPRTPLGFVLMTTIEHDDEKMMYTSDVQGPMTNTTSDMILEEDPKLLFIGGPPTYLKGYRVTEQQIKHSLENLTILTAKIPITILDHHILRDSKWQDHTKRIIESAQNLGNIVVTAAEYIGRKNQLLEAKREQFFKTSPPDPSFLKWASSDANRRAKKPPL